MLKNPSFLDETLNLDFKTEETMFFPFSTKSFFTCVCEEDPLFTDQQSFIDAEKSSVLNLNMSNFLTSITESIEIKGEGAELEGLSKIKQTSGGLRKNMLKRRKLIEDVQKSLERGNFVEAMAILSKSRELVSFKMVFDTLFCRGKAAINIKIEDGLLILPYCYKLINSKYADFQRVGITTVVKALQLLFEEIGLRKSNVKFQKTTDKVAKVDLLISYFYMIFKSTNLSKIAIIEPGEVAK